MESLRIRYDMEPHNEETARKFKLNANNHWLRARQGLALPALPPTTPEARKYFFANIQKFATAANQEGKSKIDFDAFAREWNRSADGKVRYYVTADVLCSYTKS